MAFELVLCGTIFDGCIPQYRASATLNRPSSPEATPHADTENAWLYRHLKPLGTLSMISQRVERLVKQEQSRAGKKTGWCHPLRPGRRRRVSQGYVDDQNTITPLSQRFRIQVSRVASSELRNRTKFSVVIALFIFSSVRAKLHGNRTPI